MVAKKNRSFTEGIALVAVGISFMGLYMKEQPFAAHFSTVDDAMRMATPQPATLVEPTPTAPNVPTAVTPTTTTEEASKAAAEPATPEPEVRAQEEPTCSGGQRWNVKLQRCLCSEGLAFNRRTRQCETPPEVRR